jgi:glycosyltransferase A (GT-A) superfamily protein (DUF2064 family)
MTTILIVAKAPVPGHAKTRLGPQLTPQQAATLAAAALLDTLDAALAVSTASVVVALTGSLREAPAGRQIAMSLRGCRVIGQRGSTFGERLAHAHLDAAGPLGPILQIGMDTPQVTPDLLRQSIFTLQDGVDAALGPAEDGGWWALALREARHARVLAGVPMSTPETHRHTASALSAAGLVIAPLPTLVDVDTAADAETVARSAPGTRFGELAALLLDARRRAAPVPDLAEQLSGSVR